MSTKNYHKGHHVHKRSAHILRALLLLAGLMSSGCRTVDDSHGRLRMQASDAAAERFSSGNDLKLLEVPEKEILSNRSSSADGANSPQNPARSLLASEREGKRRSNRLITTTLRQEQEPEEKIRNAFPPSFECTIENFKNTSAQDLNGLNRDTDFLEATIGCKEHIATTLRVLRQKRRSLEYWRTDGEEDVDKKAIIRRFENMRADLKYLKNIFQDGNSIFACCCFGDSEIDIERMKKLMTRYHRLASQMADKALEHIQADLQSYLSTTMGMEPLVNLNADEIDMLKLCVKLRSRHAKQTLAIIKMVTTETIANETHCQLLEILGDIVAVSSNRVVQKVSTILNQALKSVSHELSLQALKVCLDIEINNITFMQRIDRRNLQGAIELSKKSLQSTDERLKKLAHSIVALLERNQNVLAREKVHFTEALLLK